MDENTVSERQAAEFLGVPVDRLRRWREGQGTSDATPSARDRLAQAWASIIRMAVEKMLVGALFYVIWNPLSRRYFGFLPDAYHDVPYWHFVGLVTLVAMIRNTLIPWQTVLAGLRKRGR